MDDDQQFCLRWNNHQSTLISVFDTLLENGTLVDCTLAAEGKFLKAHKVVLSACSPYFAALLSQQYDKHPIFILKDVKFKELRAMMDYMYRGEVNISQDQLAALLKAAESLQIKGLSDSRGGGGNTNAMPSTQNKSDIKSHVPAPKASGLTIENKRPLNRTGIDFDTEVSRSREGSVSPSTRKRKKINQRRKSLIESNSMLDNHDQHSNSSSHSLANNQQLSNNTSATSATSNLLSVTKKTDTQQDAKNNLEQQQQAIQQKQQQQPNAAADTENGDSDDDEANELQQEQIHMSKRTKHDDTDNKHQESELMIEPKPEYDDDDGHDENVEDLTLDDEELLDDLDQAGPSHGGEGSSQGYHWQMDGRSQEEGMLGQDAAGQHRDAQELIPVNKRPGVVKKVEKVTASVVTSIVQQQSQPPQQQPQVQSQPASIQVVHAPNENQLKKGKPNHPRIKYSRHKNPTFISQLSDQHIQPLITSRPPVQTVPVLNNDTPKKIEYISLSTKITPATIAATTATPPKATIFIPNTNTQFIIQQASTPQTSSNQYEVTNTSQNNEFSSEMMDDLDYSGIDDIELPEDVQIQFSDSSFKDEGGNGVAGDSNEEHNSQMKKYHFSISDNSMASDGEDSGRQFECKTCGKRYRWKSTLRRHENVECGGKEALHQCLYCNYRSKQRGNLGVHIRKHHSDKPPLQTRRKSSKLMQDQTV